jgi:hypothetical protein
VPYGDVGQRRVEEGEVVIARMSPKTWITAAIVLFVIALFLPALGVRSVDRGDQFGSVAGYLCLAFGWLLFTTATKGLTIFFALAWLANVAWVVSLIALGRNKPRRSAILGGVAIALGLLVLIPVLAQAMVFDGADELIYGIGPGYVLWLGAIGIPLVAAIAARLQRETKPAVATAK